MAIGQLADLHYFSGKSLGHYKNLKGVNRDTIVNLRNDLRRVLHFIDKLNDDSLKNTQVPGRTM